MYGLFPDITVVSGICAWKEGEFSSGGACFLRG